MKQITSPTPLTGALSVVSSTVTAVNGIVYVDVLFDDETNNAVLYAFDALSGQQFWAKQKGRYGLTISNGMVYVFSGVGNADALATTFPGIAPSEMLNAPSSNLDALDGRLGQQRWSYQVTALADDSLIIVQMRPIVVNGMVYIAENNGMLKILDARSGQVKWSYQTKGFFTLPTIANGLIYLYNSNGLEAIQPPDGKPSFPW